MQSNGIRWNLGDLYAAPDDPAIARDLADAAASAEAFAERWRGRIKVADLSPTNFLAAVREYERIHEVGGRPYFYASLLSAADTQDEVAQRLEQRAREHWTDVRNLLLFFTLEIQAIPEERFRVVAEHEALAAYRYFLDQSRRFAPHTLSEPEEKVLNQKALTSRAAFVQLFDELSGSLRFEIEIDGERQTLTDAETMALLRSPRREVRASALEGFLSVYRSHELVLSSVFNALLLDHRVTGDLRRFSSLIQPRHLDNDVAHETVEAMMSATERHYPDIQQYFRWKAARLGLPRLAVSDVYAPILAHDEKIPFPEARELVLQSFGDFDPRFAEMAGRFFSEGWIDAEVRPGKRHGAFCASHSPKLHPWVLLSYAGTSRDVSTLAHELGHGVHAMLAHELPLLVADAPLVLAETASVFAEMLLIDAFLRRATTPLAKARILSDVLDEIYGTIFRQNALTRFELSAHEARRAGRLSASDLGRLWRAAQSSLFGDAVELPEIYDAGWSYIPHFVHSPFYCYSYTFGELLVLALFERYREEGASFVPRYFALLASGGSETPDRLLARLGLDVTRPEFWETGFRVVRRFASELAGLDVPATSVAGEAGREARL